MPLSDHTAETIAQLEAGPELDALVAEAMASLGVACESWFLPSRVNADAWFVLEHTKAPMECQRGCWEVEYWGQRAWHEDPKVALCRAVCAAALAKGAKQ